MNHSKHGPLYRTLTAFGFVSATLFGLLAACSSDGGNPEPGGPPVIGTGGGGGKGSAGATGEAGAGDPDPSGGSAQGGASSQGGSSAEAGSSSGGDAGGPDVPVCPSDDLGFLNQASSSQKAVFDNEKRLGPHATLPALN